MFSDYHVHSEFSFDSEEKIDNIISKAIELKMNQIVITDHEDFNWPVEGETPLIDLPKYNLVLSQKKEQYKNKIKLFKGIELGLMKGTGTQCLELINASALDFIIGSCHIVDNMDPYYTDF